MGLYRAALSTHPGILNHREISSDEGRLLALILTWFPTQ
jgi:hypothetical protein